MTDSILNSVKLNLGIPEDHTEFDTDILMHINSAFSVLHQVGASPEAGFSINDEFSDWSDFVQGVQNVQMVKTYVCLKVKLIFDPPNTSYALASMEKVVSELEWRLNMLEDLFKATTP